MGIDIDDLRSRAQDLVGKHGARIEEGVTKAGEFVKQRAGHEQQVDRVVDKIRAMIPDRTAQPDT